MLLRKPRGVVSFLVLTVFLAASYAKAGLAIRLEKEVPQSAVKGVNPITASIFVSQTAASPVATQNFGVGELMVSMLDTLSGAPQYRVRMDFTETAALNGSMELWWEFSLGGNVTGKRERVPQSAYALFAGNADTVDGQHASDFAASGHGHTGLGSGDITAVGAGTGLTGGGTEGDVALEVDTAFVQRRVSVSCAAGSSIRAIDANGDVTCEEDTVGSGDITAVGAGTGLSGGGIADAVTLSADTTYLQRRVSGSCSAGNSIRSINPDGTVSCESDSDGAPLGGTTTLSGGTAWTASSPVTGITNYRGLAYLHNNAIGTNNYYHAIPVPEFLAGNPVGIDSVDITYDCTAGESISQAALISRYGLTSGLIWVVSEDTTGYAGTGTISLSGDQVVGVITVELGVTTNDAAGYCTVYWEARYNHF